MTKVKPFDEDTNEIDTSVRSTFKPLTVVLQLLGLYIPQHRKGIARRLHWFYSSVLVFSLWANAARLGMLFKFATGLSESLTTTSAQFIIYLGNSYLSLVIVMVLSRKLDPLFDTMNTYHRQHGFAYKGSLLSKVILLSCVCGGLISVSSSSVMMYIFSIPGSKFKRYLFPFENCTGSTAIAGKVVLWLVTTLALSNFYIIMFVFGSISYCLIKEFGSLNEVIKSSLNTGKTNHEDQRLHHSDICVIVAEANGILTHILFTVLAVTLPISCLILYGVIVGSLPLFDLLMLLCTGLCGVFIMFALLTSSTILNVKAHESFDDIMRCRLKGLPGEEIQALTLFSTRLAGPPIGFSVYGLFTIDTSAILTIIGTLLTYAVVMIQFKPTE